MSELEPDLLELLARDYGVATAARALWQWAGGKPEEVPHGDSAAETWQALWERTAQDEPPVSRMALLRELLYDRPGHPLLLELLAEIALERCPAAVEGADFLLLHLERLAPLGYPQAGLRTYLATFPAEAWEESFCALAPALHEWGGGPDRERLAQACQQLSSLTDAVARLEVLRERMREQGDGEDAPAVALATSALEELRGMREQLEDAGDAYQRGVGMRLGTVVKRLEFRRQLTPKMVVAALTSLLVQGRKLVAPENARLASIAEGLRIALYATRPGPGDWVDEAPEEDAAELEDAPA